jgi:hypothetical protein
LFMTEKIESSIFHVVPTGVQLTMEVSERFQSSGQRGGYCYVNFPWIDKTQWHAFSLFENPSNRTFVQLKTDNNTHACGIISHHICIYSQRRNAKSTFKTLVTGRTRSSSACSVTRSVLCGSKAPFPVRTTVLLIMTTRSWWQVRLALGNRNSFTFGPHPSLFPILLLGGIGITPAISVMRAHSETRRTNLIWAVRDPHMLEFFLKHAEFSKRGWNLIFYTGKDPLYIGDASNLVTATGAMVHVIKARPDFEKLIPNVSSLHTDSILFSIVRPCCRSRPFTLFTHSRIHSYCLVIHTQIIYSIESGAFVPEAFASQSKLDAIDAMEDKLTELDKDYTMTSNEKISELINYADELGYLFTDLIHEITGDTELSTLMRAAEGGGSAPNDMASTEFVVLDALRRSDRTTRGVSTMKGLMRQQSHDSSHGSGHKHSFATRTWNAIETKKEINSFKPWEADSTVSEEYVKNLDKALVLSTWGVLYCGGKSPLAEKAEQVSAKYHLQIALESFAW